MTRSSKNKKLKFKTESEYTLALEAAVKELLKAREPWNDYQLYEYDDNVCRYCDADDAHLEEYQLNGMMFTRVIVTHRDNCPWNNLKNLIGE